MEKLILAIDQGTTATTVLVINQSLQVIAKESTEILPTYPQAAWVEHDLNKIWDGTVLTIKNLLQKNKISTSQILAIGITNQRETVGAWNKKTMTPKHNAIVWQCRRTADFCEQLKARGLQDKIKEKTGLVLDPYFSGSKMHWLLENVSGLKEEASRGDIAFGTIDTFLVYQLSAGTSYVTDVSNASRTMLMNLKTLEWDKELLEIFQVPFEALPKISASSEVYGHTKGLSVLPDGIAICGILGDQQAALFGQLCTSPGDAKCTYGTGSFLMCNTGEKITYSKHGMLTTVAWKIKNETHYALEGSAFVAGAAVQWLRDGLGIIKSSSEVEALALSVQDKDMGELVFVPALAGMGAPHWRADARGMLHGITRGTTKAHIARAVLDGIAHQNDELFSAINEDLGKKLNVIKVDGGASANNYLMQLQSDLAETPILRPKILDTTALGAALAAGLAIGFWKDIASLKNSWHLDREFKPKMNDTIRLNRKKLWSKAVARVLS